VIPAVERGWVDGVPVLRAGSASGRNAAALVFRVGHFDEALPNAGITHLVEHLALGGTPKAPYQFNAAVSGRFTAFYMESPDPADAADFVATVCRGLASDSSASLDREKRILRTEAASRGGAGALGLCLNERYGATGPGLRAYEEYGLRRLGWQEIDTWRRRWFVAGNAVLWIHGTVPHGLRVELPSGPAPAATPLRPTATRLPGFVLAGGGGIGMSLAGRQSVAASVTLDILQERMTQVLRHDYGLSYGVTAASEPLDSDMTHTWLVADALPEQVPMVAHTMLATFEGLAEDGGTDAEARDYARRLRDAYESPSGPAMILHRQAQSILSARPVREPGETLRAVSEVDRKAVSEVAGELLGQAIVATPQLIPAVQGRMPRLPLWSAEMITGAEYMSQQSGATLTVGRQGVMLTAQGEQHVTVRAGALAALLRWNDGKRALIGTDGFIVQLDPADWPDGDAVLRSIEASVAGSLVVDIDSPGPARPRQDKRTAGAAQPAQPAQPSGPAAAPGKGTRSIGWGSRIIRALWVVLIIVGLMAILGSDLSGGAGFAAVGMAGLAGQQLMIRRRIQRLGDSGRRG
jgi:zinc protease